MAKLQQELQRVDRLADLMDERFEVPVVGWKVGLDPLLGLLPVGGDWAAWLGGVYIFWTGLRLGVPRRLLGAIVLNTLIDLVVGYVPVIGDLFDFAYKSNRKNVNLLFEYFDVHRRDGRLESGGAGADPRTTGRWVRYLVGVTVTVVLLTVAALPLVFTWWLLQPG